MIETSRDHTPGHGLDRTWRLGSDGRRSPPPPLAVSSPDASRALPAAILIVEDDWFIASDIHDLVTAAGYRVLEIATTADEAVAAAVAGRPDLVLMDIRLVGPKDGIDAALAIRERVDIPCLMVSAHQNAQLRARAAPARLRGWLMKPFSDRQLLAAIESALQPDQAS
jgi:two-component system, response regulator PdtaR